MNIKAKDSQFIMNTYSRNPVVLVKGSGAQVFDEQGREYIDLGSGIGVNIFGYADGQWQAAIAEQAAKLQHTSNLYYSEPCVRLAELLCEKTGFSRVFFSNSGAEANECAIKAARRYSYLKYDSGRHYIITLKNSFHGRTLATLTATGQDPLHKEFNPFLEGFLYASAEDVGELDALLEQYPVCAVMVEAIQGEGGVMPLQPAFLERLKSLLEGKDILLICDEVQSGNGRSGNYFAYMRQGLQPDIVSTAKGLGGGLPLGATLFNEKTKEALGYGTHGSTFGGNPIACAGACSVVSRITPQLMAEVEEKSLLIRQELEGAEGVEQVSGMGLMLGIATRRPAKEVLEGCLKRGVLVLTAHERLRLLPPLNIDKDLLKDALAILKEELAK